MFVLDTIKLKKGKNFAQVETSLSIKITGLSGFIISYYFFYLAHFSDVTSVSIILSFGLIFFMGSGLYFALKDKYFYIDENRVFIVYRLLFFVIKKYCFFPKDIDFFYTNECSGGQTIQKKYRIFFSASGEKFDIGIVNNKNKADYILHEFNRYL